jgi:O-antigen ligase
MDIFVFGSALFAAFGLLTTDIMAGYRVRALQSMTMTWGAMSALFTLITVCLILFGGGGKKRILYVAAFAVQLTSMLFSYVRGAWVGFVAGLFVLALIRSKKLLLAAVLLGVVVFMVAPAPIKTRVLSITDLSVNSTRVRLTQWSNAVNIFLDHPVLGVGWIDLNDLHKQYAPEGADLGFHAYNIGHFHNNFIMFLIYFGLAGFLAGLYLVVRLLSSVYHIYRRKVGSLPRPLSAWVLGTLAALTGFWINGLFDWTFGDAEPVTLMWFTVGLCLAIDRMAEGETT